MAELNPRIVPVPLAGSPQEVYARVGQRHLSALLESSKAMPGLSGWSYIAGPALGTLETDGDATSLHAIDGSVQEQWADPFDALRDVMARLDSSSTSSLPDSSRPRFTGGLIGYLGYDLARHVERLPSVALDDPALPRMRLLLCDHVLAFDHAHAQWYFCCIAWPGADVEQRELVWAETLAQAQGRTAPAGRFWAGPMVSRTEPADYLSQVRQVLDFVAAGDIFQANLSHRMEGAFDGDPFALYQRLTALNPAPFAAYLQGDEFAVASVSPERFLKVTQREVTARPIKGTRSRDADAAQDSRQHDALLHSVKDRAENVMIVDLMRNDLGRVAQVGSVKVDTLFEIEAHPSVWQMVSTVRARLRDDATAADLLRACWPPGSMTGAPKVRAMEIIESLEPLRRGVYAGAIGYLDHGGDIDLSVVIRTAVVHRDRVMVQVGGAIVTDSVPQAELDETHDKGRLLVRALQAEAS